MRRNCADFSFEKKLWGRGLKAVAGVDEVGRGCFAGPVVAGCVVFPDNVVMEEFNGVMINDSKQLKPRQRERSTVWIKENASTWGIGEAPTTLINRIGMAKATKTAFRRAIAQARQRLSANKKCRSRNIDFLLIDAFFVPYVPGLPTKRRKDGKGRYKKKVKGRQQAIVNGDEKSISIAAASIIAKVYRDSLMRNLSKKPKYKKYGWGRNKGYGTAEHQKAIRKYGITRYHRKAFVETYLSKLSN